MKKVACPLFLYLPDVGKRIVHPLEVLSVNQQLGRIRIVEVDIEKQKVALSLREE